jgi:alginate O-acetyltransferase complex protein AlgI
MQPWTRLLLATVGGIYLIKVLALAVRYRAGNATGLATFLFAWPGVIPAHFVRSGSAQPIDAGRFLAAWLRFIAGLSSVVLLAIYAGRISEPLLSLAGLAALILTLHLGICDLLPWLLRWAGFDVPLLFDRPWISRTLAEFWGRRWNLAFVEMNQWLFLRLAHRYFGGRGARLALFALSGLLHELALSFPASAGWGMPLGYFLLQGVLVESEHRFRIANRAWTWFWLIAPAPWLFHEAFRQTLIVPFFRWLHECIAYHTAGSYLSWALQAAVVGHLSILIASVQVPSRLHWREELAKLGRFNRKIFAVYGAYIVLCVLSFAVLTWRLHDAFLAGETSARWLAGFIAVLWTVRVLVDVFWFDYRDWPRGNAMVLGHALLTTLFACLAVVYWCAAFATL